MKVLRIAGVFLASFLVCCDTVSARRTTNEPTQKTGAASREIAYPANAGVVDVTKAPYNLLPDGVHDVTDGLQRAINEHAGSRRILYFPAGTYLVSRTLLIPLKNPQGNMLYGFTHFAGQDRERVVLRLKDGAFPDAQQNGAVLDFGRHGSADWFSCSVQNLTIEIGRNNRGAVGLRFFSNNTGCVRDVTIRSEDRQGTVGLDLAYNDMNGPLLVQRVAVTGFGVGIQTGYSVNSQTFQNIRLEKQTVCGLQNNGQCVAIEDLQSVNAVPAVQNLAGQMTLVKARLQGSGAAKQNGAIENSADLFARNIAAPGYMTALLTEKAAQSGQAGRPQAGGQQADAIKAGTRLAEYTSARPLTLFPVGSGIARSLDLPAPVVPITIPDDPQAWRSPFDFGTERRDGADISDGLQKAIDGGATTVYIPTGAWKLSHTVHLRGRVRRLIGMHSYLMPVAPLNSQDAPVFQLEEGSAPVLTLEQFDMAYGFKKGIGIQNNTRRTVALRDMEIYAYHNQPGAGPLFLENVVGGPFVFDHQHVTACQLNQETEGTHIVNRGGQVRILGLKTERGGTLVETSEQGKTEVLGGLCYTTTAGKLAPMFVSRDAQTSVSLGERCFNGDPYTTIVRESRGEMTKEFHNTDACYRGRLVLYVGSSARPKTP